LGGAAPFLLYAGLLAVEEPRVEALVRTARAGVSSRKHSDCQRRREARASSAEESDGVICVCEGGDKWRAGAAFSWGRGLFDASAKQM
jgi:hypothetical protein